MEKVHKSWGYQALMNNAFDGIHIMDLQGNLLEANDSFCKMLGYTQDEISQLNITDWNSQFSKEELLARLKDFVGKNARFETVHRRKDDTLINVEISTMGADIGGEIYFFASSRDITDRKKAEQALKAREERFQALFDGASEGILVMSTSGKLIAVNDSFAQMHGYTPEEMKKMNLKDLDPPGYSEMIPERMRRIFSEGSLHFEVENYHKDGHIFPMDVSASLIYIDGEAVIQSFSKDITERKVAEKKIQLLTQIYAAQHDTNQALIDCKDETSLFDRVCQIVVDLGGMDLAWIGINDDKTGQIKPIAVYGKQKDYLDNVYISSRGDIPEGHGPTGTAFREMCSVFVQKNKSDPLLSPWQETMAHYGWGSSGAVSIIRAGRSYAVVVFYHLDENIFSEQIIDLLTKMAKNIGRGLDRFDLEMENYNAQESMRLAAQIYHSSEEAMLITDENNLIVDINPAFTRQTGYTLEEIIGKSPRLLQSGRYDKTFYREMWQSILNKGYWQGELTDRRKDGSQHIKLANISVLRHEDGTVYRHVAQFFDITDSKKKEALIYSQANYDVLTELPNRRLFLDRLGQETKKAQHSGLALALLFIDLDRFKEVNDTLGHNKGDTLLVEAARRIMECVYETDTVARLGGDEFTIILPEFGERGHVEHIAQDIIQALSNPYDLGDGDTAYISASIGIALYPDDAQELGTLMKHADQAMYAAKTAGHNRFNYFIPAMQQEAQEKLVLTNDLRQALAHNELEVYYQPIVDRSGHITKAEALLRWKHPKRGMVGPATFIPLAEESGLIVEIGDWVFKQAIASIERWLKQFGRIIQVSVNKSPVQFELTSRPPWMDKLLSAKLPENSITVEITEGLLIKDSAKVKQRLLEFRNHGIEVSIDDFGTGFSALSYLKQFDIDYLKIDRSFVSQMNENESDKALIEAIIVMAHKLGIKTVAEGVETEAQRDLLLAFGCDYLQGYLYSQPVSAVEFEKILLI